MKPDDSMPFFGAEFFLAVEGYSDTVALGYMRALWHYWNHTHCTGLPDDDDYLRKVCHCEISQWVRTKGIIFDNQYFFCKNGTHWHQKKARELHAKELALYTRRVSWAENARAQKSQSNINPDINANISTSLRISHEKELERVERRLASIRHQGVTTAQGTSFSPQQQAELKTLKQRRGELLNALGFRA